ncbi:hypothetical protein BM449_01995 [Synechococcus sp. SynAce01]|nr:hypothetical protein BM449_01995 [Synechococcus sp. SynAce01]
MTGGVAIDKGTKTNLVDDARSGKSFHDNTDQESNHGGTAIKEFSSFELVQMDLLGGVVVEVAIAGIRCCHQF